MTVQVENFYPQLNYTVSATTNNVNTVIAQPPAVAGSAGTGNGHCNLLVQNQSTGIAYVAWGMTAATAAVGGISSVPVPVGAAMVFGMGGPMTNVAVILGSGSGSVFLSVGTGS